MKISVISGLRNLRFTFSPPLGEPEGAPYSTNQTALVFLVSMNDSDIGMVLSSPISALLHRGSCADA